MKYILVLDNIDGKMVELTKPTNWKSVVDAKLLCRGFELGGKRLFIQLCSKRVARSRRHS